MRIDRIWLIPLAALLLVACDYGGVARLMWDMQPAARRNSWPGPIGGRVVFGILAAVVVVTRLIRPADG